MESERDKTNFGITCKNYEDIVIIEIKQYK